MFLKLGIRCWMGHAPVIANSKPGPLGENQDPCGEKQEKHAARCRGACPQAPSPAATQQRTQRPGRWDFGEHETFGRCGVGVAPVQHPLLLEPAAARASCSMVENSKDYFSTGQRGADGERAVASATTSILRKAPNEKTLAAHTIHSCSKSHAAQEKLEYFQLQAWTGGVGRTADSGLRQGEHCWRFEAAQSTHTRVGELPSPSAPTHAHPRSIRMGHGSFHVDFKVNTEA